MRPTPSTRAILRRCVTELAVVRAPVQFTQRTIVPQVKLLPDGAALFTRGMGMSSVWDTNRGFGERSWRYSAVINDGKIEKLFIEGGAVTSNSGPDPFEVSDANTMLKYLQSKK